jgi:phage terminase Nu1 subunit (DNA packaging protein)
MIITGRKKIADHLDLSWGTVRKLHAREGLPLFKLGAQWAMDTEQLAQWLSRRATPYREVRHEPATSH